MSAATAAVVSGLLFLTALLGASVFNHYHEAQIHAMIALGACVVCYNAQEFTKSRVAAIITFLTLVASWGFGLLGLIFVLTGR